MPLILPRNQSFSERTSSELTLKLCAALQDETLTTYISVKFIHIPGGGGGYFTINSYGGVRRKDFCYDPIPEIWSDIDAQSQNICQILIPNRRNNKNNLTSKG